MALPKPYLCRDCGLTDPTFFYPRTKSRCKRCSSAAHLAHLAANPEAKRRNHEKAAQWRVDNPIRFRWLQARARSKRKDLDFSITEDDITALYEAQDGLCAYTKLPMSLDFNTGAHSASVDRIDSDKGYTLDNIVLCCAIVNTMKNDMSVPEFKTIIQCLYENMIPS